MGAVSMDEAQKLHDSAVAANQRLPVKEYKSGEKQSDKIFEVTEGMKVLPGGVVLGPGERFHPTERQVANGSLKNKAQELSRDQYRSLGTTERKSFGVDVDLLGKVPMAPSVRELAVESGLKTEDFAELKPEGRDETYTRKQVEALIEERAAAGAEG